MEKQMPSWLQELVDQTEERDQHHLLEMNKLRADQALAAIAVIEEKIAETEQIAQQEIDLITNWKESETTKLQNKINWLSFNLEKFIRAQVIARSIWLTARSKSVSRETRSKSLT